MGTPPASQKRSSARHWPADGRESVVLAVKFGPPFGADPNHRGASRRWITEGVEGSLRRLVISSRPVLSAIARTFTPDFRNGKHWS